MTTFLKKIRKSVRYIYEKRITYLNILFYKNTQSGENNTQQ
jgi:hypothetical protein